jgi:hypothetical protein
MTTDPSDVTKHTGTYKIAPKKSGYFYHMGQWVDLNGDGRKDYITARSNAKENGGELVYFEHPEDGLKTLPWKEHIITKGPDVIFDLINHPSHPDSYIVFAAEFFNKELTMYEICKSTGVLLNSRLIDGAIDAAYSVKYLDIDGDGKEELLVNNHENDPKKGAVFTYDVPEEDLHEGQFVKNVIASGFKPIQTISGTNMSPGFPYPVYPNTKKATGQAYILIAGDGDHSAHLLRPTGDPEQVY